MKIKVFVSESAKTSPDAKKRIASKRVINKKRVEALRTRTMSPRAKAQADAKTKTAVAAALKAYNDTIKKQAKLVAMKQKLRAKIGPKFTRAQYNEKAREISEAIAALVGERKGITDALKFKSLSLPAAKKLKLSDITVKAVPAKSKELIKPGKQAKAAVEDKAAPEATKQDKDTLKAMIAGKEVPIKHKNSVLKLMKAIMGKAVKINFGTLKAFSKKLREAGKARAALKADPKTAIKEAATAKARKKTIANKK